MTNDNKLICTLPNEQIPGQLTEWADIAAATLATEKLPNGIALELPVDVATAAHNLAKRESDCCSFLEFELRQAGDTVRMRITSEVPGAEVVIAMLVGAAS